MQPMQPSLISDPNHWRARAAELRAIAAEIQCTDAKALMLNLATDFDWLAEWAEAKASAQKLRG